MNYTGAISVLESLLGALSSAYPEPEDARSEAIATEPDTDTDERRSRERSSERGSAGAPVLQAERRDHRERMLDRGADDGSIRFYARIRIDRTVHACSHEALPIIFHEGHVITSFVRRYDAGTEAERSLALHPDAPEGVLLDEEFTVLDNLTPMIP